MGVPEKIAHAAIRALDADKRSGFPQKQKLWGGWRYWPAVVQWLDRTCGLPATKARYILKMPKEKQLYRSWQSAAAALLAAAEDERRIGEATDAIERALFLDGFKWSPQNEG